MTRSRRPLKSSLAARRLIRAALRKHKTHRAAARALRLPSHGQLAKMLAGEIRDTPAMRAALARADARAAKAWGFVIDEQQLAVDTALVLESVARLERELAMLKRLVSVDSETPKGVVG